jgi:hypothetical protein
MSESTLILTGFVVIGLLASLPGAVALRSSQRNGRAAYVAAEAIQEDVSRQIKRLSSRVEEMEKENADLRQRLEQAEYEINELERRNDQLSQAMRRLVSQVERLGQQPDVDAYTLGRLLS